MPASAGAGSDFRRLWILRSRKYLLVATNVLALEEALQELERLEPRQAMLVESRFFGGLDVMETAELLEVSEATVHREWRAAKAWLKLRLKDKAQS